MSLDTVCSSLKPLIKDVLCAKIGVCAREIELVQAATGKPALEKKRNVAIDDRFKFKIPISDQYMTWEVTFNCAFPNCPPDFDLSDPEFFYSVTLDLMEELVPSLRDWDHRKDKALFNVISELRSAYLKYQVDKLESIENPRCMYEYASLIKRVPEDHVEVVGDSNTVHFLIKLDVDLTLILPITDDYLITLAVRFGPHGTVSSATLITSANLVRLIGSTLQLHRSIKSDEELCEYVDDVARSTENQVLTVILKRQAKRKQYIFELLKRIGTSVVQYDALEYNNASFLLEEDGFVCMMEVTLPALFPSKPPQYRLISIYCTSSEDNKPFSQIQSLPYSENWDPSFMVEQALTAIRRNKIKAFQNLVVSIFRLPK